MTFYKAIIFSSTDPDKECKVYLSQNKDKFLSTIFDNFEDIVLYERVEEDDESPHHLAELKQSFSNFKTSFDIQHPTMWSTYPDHKEKYNYYYPNDSIVILEEYITSYNFKVVIEKIQEKNEVLEVIVYEH